LCAEIVVLPNSDKSLQSLPEMIVVWLGSSSHRYETQPSVPWETPYWPYVLVVSVRLKSMMSVRT
jgi:hypothetical protein